MKPKTVNLLVLVNNNQEYLASSDDFTYFDSSSNSIVSSVDDFVIGYLTSTSLLVQFLTEPKYETSLIMIVATLLENL